MANTLKFGNGEWYGKKDTILAYNDENDNYKPLPFDFSRNSSATVINKDGLIETVSSGQPRIDYKDDAKGALLLEPQRSNLVNYSEDLETTTATWWNSRGRITIENNSILSPNGSISGVKITPTNENNAHYIRHGGSEYTDGVNRTFSVFLKAGNDEKNIQIQNLTSNVRVKFNSNGELSYVASSTSEYSIEEYNDGWYRVSISHSDNSGAYRYTGIITSNDQDGASYFYIWGAQYEQGSYPTSYIPTQGATSTRIAETCNNSGSAQDFNSEEGVLYANFKIVNQVSSFPGLRLQDDSVQNQVSFYVFNNTLQFYIKSNNVNTILSSSNISENVEYKFAISYSYAETSVFLNGVKEHSFLNRNMPLGLKKINIETSSNVSKYKDIQVFTKALSDEELIELTTI